MTENRNGNGPSANGTASGAGNAYAIDLDVFSRRLKALYSHWSKHKAELWGYSDVLTVSTPASEDLQYLKSLAFIIWLLGYEFSETIIVFTNKQIHFLCSRKDASLLDVVKRSAMESVGAEVVIHVKENIDDGTTQIDAIFRSLLDGADNPVMGYIAREHPEGNLSETWDEKLKSSSLQLTDIGNGLSDLFAVKDSDEITNVKKAAFLTSAVMKGFVVPKLEHVMDGKRKVTHYSLMRDTVKAILEPSRVNLKLKAENVDLCYPPIFQSGGNYDLRPTAWSDDDYLYYDSPSVIISAIGSKYKSYCSNIARTFLIDSTTTQNKAYEVQAYEVLLKAHEVAMSAVKPGNKASDVYLAALSVVESDAPDLVSSLTKSAGIGIGLEFRESSSNLNAKNERVLKAGMAFNVTLGFHNLQTRTNNPNKSQNFSLLLADTVIVTEEGNEVATRSSSKAAKDVVNSFDETMVEFEEEVDGDSEEEKGNTSEDLEKQTSNADRENEDESDSEGEKRKDGDSEEENGNTLEDLEKQTSNADRENEDESDSEGEKRRDGDPEEEKGNTSEDLEKQASNADREDEEESDREGEKRKRKMNNSGRSRTDPSSSAPKLAKFR